MVFVGEFRAAYIREFAEAPFDFVGGDALALQSSFRRLRLQRALGIRRGACAAEQLLLGVAPCSLSYASISAVIWEAAVPLTRG